eukprot:Trichotokara_eunicae@DN6278_c6_g2_i1.p1
MSLDRSCTSANRDCLKCSGTTRCGFHSDEHVSGPKYCTDEFNPCDPPSWEGDRSEIWNTVTVELPSKTRTEEPPKHCRPKSRSRKGLRKLLGDVC